MLAVVDLNTMKVLATHPVGEDPDVLAFDPGLKGCMYLPNPAMFSSFVKTEKHSSMQGTSQSRMPYGMC